jgi:hypothetical protein
LVADIEIPVEDQRVAQGQIVNGVAAEGCRAARDEDHRKKCNGDDEYLFIPGHNASDSASLEKRRD